MFVTVRRATETARRTRKLSLPEQFSSLLKMEDSSSGCSTAARKMEVYPNCYPPPRSSTGSPGVHSDREHIHVSQFGQGLGLPRSSFYQSQQYVMNQHAVPLNSERSGSFQSWRPSTGFPHPPEASRTYHTSSHTLASDGPSLQQNNTSANGDVKAQSKASEGQSQSKRTLHESSVDSKKLCMERGGLIEDSQPSESQQQVETEAVTITSSVNGDGSTSAPPPRPDMSRFKRRWKAAAVRDRRPRESDIEVSVLNYNILAQCLIESNSDLYTNCPWDVLKWDYRKRNLLKELSQADADIMCLQEVQACHFHEFFLPELEKLGYSALYQKRTGDKNDGCTIFYKKDKFELEDAKKVPFYRSNVKLLDRDNVAIVALLRAKGPPPEAAPKLCVATTHLLYNPKRGDIKLAQLGVLLAEIDRMAAASSPSPASAHQPIPVYHPIVLCGDFNSLPHSPLYNFIRNRRLDYVGVQKVMVSGQGSSRRSFDPLNWPLWPYTVGVTDTCQFRSVVRERLTNGENSVREKQEHCSDSSSTAKQPQDWEKRFSESIQHPFLLDSVHCHDGSVCEVTTNHSRTNCTVDYIFFSSSKASSERPQGGLSPRRMAGELQLLEYLSLFTDQEATDMGGLPNHALSSDHFSLQAKFLLTAPE